MKKYQLEATEEDPFDILAILSPLKSYTLAHLLNQKHQFELMRLTDDLLYEHKQVQSYHMVYKYVVPENHNHIYLVGNKSSLPLIPERKEMDYLLLIKGEQQYSDMKGFIDQTKSIKGIQYVEYIVSNKLKSLTHHPLNYLV